MMTCVRADVVTMTSYFWVTDESRVNGYAHSSGLRKHLYPFAIDDNDDRVWSNMRCNVGNIESPFLTTKR